jgi:ABC-type sugar transport system ATPase subunit
LQVTSTSFGLKMRGTARAAIQTAVERTAAIFQIEGLLERRPKELSGGQRQRVAIRRAIARDLGSSSLMSRFPISTRSCASRCARRSSGYT